MGGRNITCPYCEETFDEGEAAYTVCLTCGEIFPPGESWVGHGPGLGEGDWVAECRMAHYEYSREDAEERQAEVREKKAERYREHGRTPPWEQEADE